MSTSHAITLALVTHRDPEGMRRALIGLRRSFRVGPRFPILILENGATETSADLAREFADLHPRWIHLERNSMCEARDRALREAGTAWVGFLDSDCRVFAGWSRAVADRLEILQARPEIWAWASPVLNRGFSFSARVSRWLGRFFPAHAKVARAASVAHVPSSQVFYRREKILAVGGFPEGFDRVGEDLSLSNRIRANGGEIWVFPEPRVLHAQSSGIATHLLRLERYGRAQGALFRRAPEHLGDRRFLPLLASVAGLGLLGWNPAGAGVFLVLAAFAWAWKGPRMGGALPQIAGLIFVFVSVLCYAGGTVRGMLNPSSVRRS